MVLCHISHVYETGCSLYFTVAAKEADDPLRAVAGRPRPPPATRSSPPAPRSPTTTRSAPTTSRGWPHEIGELGVSVLRAVKADLDPTGDPQPGGADPVTTPASLHVPGQPGLRAAAPRPAAVVPVARLLREAGADGRGHLLARPAGDGAPWSTPRSAAATSSSRSAATGCSRRSPAWSRPRGGTLGGPAGRPRQRLRPDARAARRPGRGQAALLLERRRAPGRPALAHAARRRRRGSWPARSTAGVDARAAEIVDRSHWLPRKAAVPVRRGPLARDVLARRATGSRSTATSAEYAAANVVVANSAYYGKGMKIAPAAAVDDGVLDVVVIEAASKLGPDARAAQGVRRRARRPARGHRAHRQAGRAPQRTPARPVPVGGDGEPLGQLPALADEPAVVEVQPGALAVIA